MSRSPARALRSDPLASEAHALCDAMSNLIKVYQFRDRDRMHCHGVSVTECYALEAVVRRGALRLVDLAGELHLEKSTMSRAVDALQRKGLVERRAHQRDRRALQIYATAAGRRLHERIAEEFRQRYRRLLEDVPEESRSALIGLLDRLARAGIAAPSGRDDRSVSTDAPLGRVGDREPAAHRPRRRVSGDVGAGMPG